MSEITAGAVTAFLIIHSVAHPGSHHEMQTVNVIRYAGGMADCANSLVRLANKVDGTPAQGALIRPMFCTDKQPDWWVP